MDIERINEHTVKFYISYGDIEKRGFDQDEIWYDREKSEQLFWELMDDIELQNEFLIEGPLWIQVQALDKGLEVIVTKAQLSEDGHKLEFAVDEDKILDLPMDEKMESLLEQHFQTLDEEMAHLYEDELSYSFVFLFGDLEDVIALSHRIELPNIINELYSFENRYYLYVEFKEDIHEEREIDMVLSLLLEYANESNVTIHRIQEYGKVIVKENALGFFRDTFSL